MEISDGQNIQKFLSCRFLLARHRAALDVYSEAQKMSPKDWVFITTIGQSEHIAMNIYFLLWLTLQRE